MPAIKSAQKRVRTAEKAQKRNIPIRSRITSARRRAFEAFSSKNADESERSFREYCSVMDKAAKKGVIKKNTAVRRKRRAAEALRKKAATA